MLRRRHAGCEDVLLAVRVAPPQRPRDVRLVGCLQRERRVPVRGRLPHSGHQYCELSDEIDLGML